MLGHTVFSESFGDVVLVFVELNIAQSPFWLLCNALGGNRGRGRGVLIENQTHNCVFLNRFLSTFHAVAVVDHLFEKVRAVMMTSQFNAASHGESNMHSRHITFDRSGLVVAFINHEVLKCCCGSVIIVKAGF